MNAITPRRESGGLGDHGGSCFRRVEREVTSGDKWLATNDKRRAGRADCASPGCMAILR